MRKFYYLKIYAKFSQKKNIIILIMSEHSNEDQIKAIMQKRLKYWKKKAERDKKKDDPYRKAQMKAARERILLEEKMKADIVKPQPAT